MSRKVSRRWKSKFARFVGAIGVGPLALELDVRPSAIYHWIRGATVPLRPVHAMIIQRLAHERGHRLTFDEIYRHSHDLRAENEIRLATPVTAVAEILPFRARSAGDIARLLGGWQNDSLWAGSFPAGVAIAGDGERGGRLATRFSGRVSFRFAEMRDELQNLEAHVEACEVCTKANRRVNDFCKAGRILFALWNPPLELVDVTEAEYDRLVEELVRSVFDGETARRPCSRKMNGIGPRCWPMLRQPSESSGDRDFFPSLLANPEMAQRSNPALLKPEIGRSLSRLHN